MWILMALLSALLAATRRTSEKRLTAHLHHFTMGWAIQLCSLPLIFISLVLWGEWLNPFHLGANFWWPLAAVCIGFYPLNNYLYFQAIRHDELSNVLPIMSLWPVFSLLPAWLLLHETPSPAAISGIIIIVSGVYVLGLKGRTLHRPWQPFVENKSSRYTLMAVLLLTAVAVLDKIAIKASEAIYFSFLSTIGAVLVLFVTACICRVREGKALQAKLPQLGILGSLQGGSYTTYLLAMSLGPVAYVSAIRSSNILIGSLLGVILLKESFTTNKKLSLVLIACGSALLMLGS
jgi:drug/metabolite transporter (DMT)-like permease